MENKIFRIQTSLFVTYTVLTALFFLGWHNSMVVPFLPEWLGDILQIPTMIYFAGGALAIPIGWFIFLIYHYQVTGFFALKTEEKDFRGWLNKLYFPISVLFGYLFNLIYVFYLGYGDRLDLVHFAAFIIFLLVLFLMETKKEIKSLLIVYSGVGLIVAVGLIDLVVNSDFELARLAEQTFIYSISYGTVYYFLWIVGIAFVSFLLFGYFRIKDRIKFANLLAFTVALLIAFLNVVRLVNLFNLLNG
ncbi:MAG TPA: hypothetical protein DD618_02830 [Acholeplasmatales bacterium]|nr:hypothetical protein [Acholeplasmatales bacterium]